MADSRIETKHTRPGTFCYDLAYVVISRPPCFIKEYVRFSASQYTHNKSQFRMPYIMCQIGTMR